MKFIKGFDTLRGISIIFVLITHLGLYHLLPENSYIRQRVWLLMSGTTGVQIFFTLSGFLITKILLHELNEHNRINFLHFYVRRFLRLLPPLIVFYIITATLMHQGMIESTRFGFLLSFFYLYNFVPNTHYTSELGHTWSLALEEQYYLLWPFVISYFKKKTAFILILILLLTCVIAIHQYPTFSFTKGFRPSRWFIPAVAPIVIGSFFAWLINNQEGKYRTYFKQKNKYLLIGLLFFLFPLYTPTPILDLSFIFQSIGISFVLIWVLYNQNSKFTTILGNKFLSYIGTISYGLYVYQGLYLTTGPSGKLWIQQFPQNLVLTFLTAVLSFHLLEKPILKLKKKFKGSVLKKA